MSRIFCAGTGVLAVTVCAMWGIVMLAPAQASAFCGFYVSGGTTKLYNKATQVVLMREGTRTILSMRNNYQGPAKDFAMVVPVPVVLQREDVDTLDDTLFDKIDALGAPRLVKYWEQNPCPDLSGGAYGMGVGAMGFAGRGGGGLKMMRGKSYGVTVRARFTRGEYDIVVLSAKESNGLERWLVDHRYNIPKGAAKVLNGYIQQGMYFFVARVNMKKVKYDRSGKTQLSPLRFAYTTENFSLPVRLGLLNAKGKQDLVINILARNQRYEVANYKNATIPTNLIVDRGVERRFGAFYNRLLDYTLKENPGAVVTEYAWQAQKCDPCPSIKVKGRTVEGALTRRELGKLGLDVLYPVKRSYSTRWNERTHVVQGRAPASLGHLRYLVRARVQACMWAAQAERKKNRATRSQRGDHYTITLSLDPKAGKASASVVRSESFRTSFGGFGRMLPREERGCVKESLEAIDAATIQTLQLDGPLTVHTKLSAEHVTHTQRRYARQRYGWTLTRLHARYTEKEMTRDMVFKKATPIRGGVGMPQGVKGTLRVEGAQPARANSFQGRYVILNRWKRKLTCKNPQRGMWGGPLDDSASVARAARGLAFAGRGRMSLRRAIKSRNQPGLPWFKPRRAAKPKGK